MPVHKVPGGGWQWGQHGKIYRGKGAERKAYAQAAAAEHHGYHEKASDTLTKPRKASRTLLSK